jgi:hypothetical protein
VAECTENRRGVATAGGSGCSGEPASCGGGVRGAAQNWLCVTAADGSARARLGVVGRVVLTG